MLATFLADASDIIKQSADLACKTDCNTRPLGTIIGSVTTTLLGVIAAISVLMIIIGGLRYVISGGDPKKTADAKNTILYAIVGVVVALLAFAIVSFVTTSINSPGAIPTPLSTPKP